MLNYIQHIISFAMWSLVNQYAGVDHMIIPYDPLRYTLQGIVSNMSDGFRHNFSQ